MTQAIIDIKKACKTPPTNVVDHPVPENAAGNSTIVSSTAPLQAVETPGEAVEKVETNPCISL